MTDGGAGRRPERPATPPGEGSGRRSRRPAAPPGGGAGSRRGRATVGAVAGAVAILLAWVLAGVLSGGGAALGGRPATGGLRLQVWDTGTGERFTLRHVHSVTRRPVKETYSVTAEGIAMEEMWFDSFGANLPAGPERIGGVTTTFLVEDGGYRVLHHGRLMPVVPLLVGRPGVNHRLRFADGDRLRLLDLVRPSTPVELRAAAGSSDRDRAGGR